MKTKSGYIAVGLLLIALGVLFLLQNFGVLSGLESLIWVVLFGLGGLAFLAVFVASNEQWWALIPGFTLLGLAVLIGLGDRLGAWGAVIFMASIGLSFWAIYLLRREHWWAIIPGGSLFSVAALIAAAELGADEGSVGVLFLGLAITFGLVYLLPSSAGRMKWAIYPAAVLAVMGVIFLAAMGNLFNFVWPLALIAAGGFLVLRHLLGRR
jgi:hypothetical protein